MLIELQGGAEVIRTDIIRDIWVQFGKNIIAKLDGEPDMVTLARYSESSGMAGVVFREIVKAMQVDSNELLILPDDEEEDT